MTDTREHIKALQLKIWLSKPPMERLRQMIKDNEALLKFWSGARKKDESGSLHQNIDTKVGANDKKV